MDGYFAENVRYPTRLGNLIDAYEQYPYRLYGFESTFLWYRIWLRLDKDRRDEIDNSQAMADSAIYITASLYLVAALNLIYYLLSLTMLPLYNLGHNTRWTWLIYLAVSVVSALAAFGLYRVSLFVHDNFGRLFKAVFDNFIAEISFPAVEKQVDRILSEKTIDLDTETRRNTMIMDYMSGSRLDSPLEKGKRVWPAEWNQYLRQTTTSKEPILVAHGSDLTPVVSCKGQSVQ